MLSKDQLEALYHEHRDDWVLSVYLDADQHDFAERGRWRVALKNELSEQRRHAPDPELLDRAHEHVEEALQSGRSFLQGRGWAGFATSEERLHADSLPVAMPDLVRWEKGLRVAPYARALKATRPVIGVVVDSRRARVISFGDDRSTHDEELHADTYLGDLTDVNVAKRATDRSGVRGKTGTDAAQRYLEVERDRLLTRVAEEVRARMDGDAFVLLGGVRRALEGLARELDLDSARMVKDPHLSLDSSNEQLQQAAEETRRTLSAAHEAELVESVVDRARAGGDASLGEEDTHQALREMRVDTLVVSERRRRERPDDVDRAEGTAFEQSANVIEVRGEAGERLDQEGEGLGSLLRYRVDPPGAS
jgi:hypothetical protein